MLKCFNMTEMTEIPSAQPDWSVPDEPTMGDDKILHDFINHAEQIFKDMCAKYGGPAQYLRALLKDEAAQQEFLNYLWQKYPESETAQFHRGPKFPDVGSSTQFFLHVGALGFLAMHSTKPEPLESVCLELNAEILKDGFVTDGDPLILAGSIEHVKLSVPWPPESGGLPLAAFSASYIKGMARCCTLLALLHLCKVDGVEIKDVHPKLWSSCCLIAATHRPHADRRSEALENFKLSCRGSIRKPPNVITFVGTVFNLGLTEEKDFTSFAKDWNKASSKQFQITGQKAMTLKLMVTTAPRNVVDSILSCVSSFGWAGCPYSDDSLSSRKIYPGFQFRCTTSRKWMTRLKTSAASMSLHIQKVGSVHGSTPWYMRGKMEKTTMESLAEQAAATYNIGLEIQKEVPIPDSVLKDTWMDRWANGCPRMDSEIQSALADKSDSWGFNDSTVAREIIQMHMTNAPIGVPLKETQQLEQDDFDLMMKKIVYDQDVWRVFLRKYSGYNSATYFKKLDWRKTVEATCLGYAKDILTSCVTLMVWQPRSEETIREFVNMKRDLQKKCIGDEIISIAYMNWTAPSSIPGNRQEAMNNLFSFILHDGSENNIGLVQMPVFTYKKGLLWHLEQNAMNLLTKAKLNADVQYTIPFSGSTDLRDSRPLTYPGRILVPMTADLNKGAFRHSYIVKWRRTEETQQLPAKDMFIVEDLSDQALPSDIDHQWIHGAQKYAQLGKPALRGLIQAIFQDADTSGAKTFLVTDLALGVAYSLQAFLDIRKNSNLRMHFCGICDDMVEYDWVFTHVVKQLAHDIAQGTVKPLSGHTVTTVVPTDLLEEAPAKPQLNVLVLGGKDKDVLQLPTSLIRKYAQDSRFRAEFETMMDKHHSEFGAAMSDVPDTAELDKDAENKDQPVQKSPLKKPRVGPAPVKTDKVPPTSIVEASQIVGQKIWECPMANIKDVEDKLKISIRIGNKVCIYNLSGQEVKLPAGTVVASFGKGGFKLLRKDQETEDAMVAYSLKDDEDMVIFNGTLTKLGTVVEEKRKTEPNCSICYFSMENRVSEANPGGFSLQANHRVVFYLKTDESIAVNQNNMASKLPATTWDSEVTKIVWAVRWTTKGLMPVCPRVVLHRDCDLGTGRALVIV